jgi:hypothetical protein
MFALLAPLIGTAVSALTGSLNQAYKDRLNAKNDAERIEADKQISFYQGQISLAVEAAKNDKWWSTRELLGKIALIYVAKIVVWDTVLQLGSTPDPGPQVTGIVMLVLGFFVGSKAVTDIASNLLKRAR